MRKVADFGGELALNVIRCSTYSMGHLNRQFVMHLSILGAQESFFVDKLQKSINDLPFQGQAILKLEEESKRKMPVKEEEFKFREPNKSAILANKVSQVRELQQLLAQSKRDN